jgi:SAM-dependent methyltransferase
MLAPQCDSILALDINEIALRKAEERCAELPQCRFLQLDVTQRFPQGFYDGIVLSEVGYYLIEESLLTLFEDINRSLMPGGSFLMVHWTAYVRNYPLTGKEVHRLFKKNFSKYFRLIHHQNASLYEIQCWEKIVEEK